MQKIPKETFIWYQGRLEELGVADRSKPHYVKWVRYFLDFESKYGAGALRAALIDGFLCKLAQKGQSPQLRAQAREAVAVYLNLAGEVPEAGDADLAEVPELEPVAVEPRAAYGAAASPEQRGGSASREAWAELEAAVAGEIRRRNYSSKTLKDYVEIQRG